jgi:hypothetical protein
MEITPSTYTISCSCNRYGRANISENFEQFGKFSERQRNDIQKTHKTLNEKSRLTINTYFSFSKEISFS